jgi:hypothetical protein
MFDLEDIFASQQATVVFMYATAALFVMCAVTALMIGLSAARHSVRRPSRDGAVVQLNKQDLRRAA